ncbi:MAG TPA: DNA polymerase Y family protein [Acidobacteriaceae bacterium]|jgi:protein ImuB|nr:DNA polymerase Y family protein [Acidobacteriaceae bacterium]
MNRPGELYACVYVREFPAQAMVRLRLELREKPVAILEGEAPRQWVCSKNIRAHALGVEAGMTRAEMEVFPAVALLPRARAEEASARAALLQAASRFSPRIEDRSEEGCFCGVLDIAGTEKLFGPPETLARHLLQSIGALGLRAAVVVSRNLQAAVGLARSLPVRVAVIPSEQEAAMLAPLPLTVLPLTPEQMETLTRWGIAKLGDLAELPEKELIARLGQEGRRLRHLARGEAPHLLVPADPVLALEEQMELEAPVELLDSLLFVLGVLLDYLIARAASNLLALASVTVQLSLEGGGVHTRTVHPALPGNDRRLWLRLLHLDLQGHPPPAAILAIKLSADPGSTSKTQMGLFTPELPEPDRLDVTLARLRAVVGDERVGRAVLEDTHQPDAFRMVPFAIPEKTAAAPEPQAQARSARRRLRPPEPVTVTLRERKPVSFFFRGKRYDVERAWGPWFFSGNWWGVECWSMEKWDVVARCEANGTTICCALARNPMRPATIGDWRMEELYD